MKPDTSQKIAKRNRKWKLRISNKQNKNLGDRD